MIFPTVIFLLIALSFLFFEQIQISRWHKKIPLRISVTGTRGKSSIVRMLSSVFRENGLKTFSKTTGSEPVYILPDGSTHKIKRRGLVSIIEQKNLLRLACRNQVQYLITEIMSIHPENHFIETQKILKPHMTIVSNLYPDHLESLEGKQKKISEIFSFDIYNNSDIFLHKNQEIDYLLKNARQKGCRVHLCSKKDIESIRSKLKPGVSLHPENINLVHRLCKTLGLSDKNIISGINKTVFDIGEFKIWDLNSKNLTLVNAFGANDPKSTMLTLKKTLTILKTKQAPVVGFLNLRIDRPARTLQWIDYFQNRPHHPFTQLYIHGGHCSVFKKKIPESKIVSNDSVFKIVEQIQSDNKPKILFGFGNIKGAGKQMINYFINRGIEYEY